MKTNYLQVVQKEFHGSILLSFIVYPFERKVIELFYDWLSMSTVLAGRMLMVFILFHRLKIILTKIYKLIERRKKTELLCGEDLWFWHEKNKIKVVLTKHDWWITAQRNRTHYQRFRKWIVSSAWMQTQFYFRPSF